MFYYFRGSHLNFLVILFVALVVKNQPVSPGDIRDVGLIPGLGRSPGGGHGNPLQYSCLESPMDRGAWWAVVHGVAIVGYDLVTTPPVYTKHKDFEYDKVPSP